MDARAIAEHLLHSGVPFSRNRHFAAYDDPLFRRGLALYRRLVALIAELETAARQGAVLSVAPATRRGVNMVLLQWELPRARRTAWLDADVWAILTRHPAAQQHLDVLSRGRPHPEKR